MAGERFDEAKAMCDRLCDEYPNSEYGPAHVVVSDYNLEDHFVQGCRHTVEMLLTHGVGNGAGQAAGVLRATRDVLDALLAIPEDERCCPEDKFEVSDGPN